MTRPTSTAQDLWAQVSPVWGRWAISWKLWLAFGLPRVLGTWAVTMSLGNTPFAVSALCMLIGYLASGLVLALSSLTVLRHRLTRPPRIPVVLAVWFISGLVMVLTAAALLAASTGQPLRLGPADAARFAVLHVLRIGLPCLAICLLDAGLTRAHELRRSVEERQTLVEHAARHLDSLRERHLDALRTGLMPRFHDLSDEVSGLLESSPAAEAGDLSDLGDLPQRIDSFGRGEVRDLSHRVARGDFVVEADPRRAASTSTASVGAFLGAAFSLPAPAILAASLYAFLASGWSGLHASWEAVGLVATQVLAILLILGGARQLCLALAARSTGTRVGVTVLSSLLAVAAIVWVQQPPTVLSALPTVAQASSAIAGSLLLAGAYRQQRSTLAALALAESQLAAQVDRLRREAETIRQRIAQLLHGTIQGRLALTSLRLTELRRLTDPDARAHARNEILALLASVEAEFRAAEAGGDIHGPATLDATLDAIARDWKGLLHTTWTISTQARAALRTRPLLSDEIGDIVAEAVTNARRHGGAHGVVIDIDIVDAPGATASTHPVELCVTVIDDGVGPDAAARPGLGHTMLASMGARWTLARVDQARTVLTVVLAAPAEAAPSFAEDLRVPALGA